MNSTSTLASTKRNGVAWDSDAVPQDAMSSLDVLLEWLTDGDNYTRWRAGSQKKTPPLHANSLSTSRSLPVVVSKEKLCQEIVNKFHDHGLSHRSSREVRSKINDLERSYRAARDWANTTGEGVREEDEELGQTNVRAKIIKICKHYDALHPIMGDRPSARPIFTNEEEDEGDIIQEKNQHGMDNFDDADDDDLAMASSHQQRSYPSSSFTHPPANQPSTMSTRTSKRTLSRTAIEKGKLQLETKRLRLDEEKTKWEVEIRRIQALARLELKTAGMSDEEIAEIFD
ncbi:hypothetical protein Ae201684P_005204 [Aphanomyces euteiches]|nr:hypothetical protein Ae201684P_005204 [Aphanomyces euteiches]KAH9139483.1 hypothetical protein AeRB84_016240 [Aphanomyces euteiches]